MNIVRARERKVEERRRDGESEIEGERKILRLRRLS